MVLEVREAKRGESGFRWRSERSAPTSENAENYRLGHTTKPITRMGGCYCGRSSEREGRTSDNAISCVSTGGKSLGSPAR
jgi:hypothetical protein